MMSLDLCEEELLSILLEMWAPDKDENWQLRMNGKENGYVICTSSHCLRIPGVHQENLNYLENPSLFFGGSWLGNGLVTNAQSLLLLLV